MKMSVTDNDGDGRIDEDCSGEELSKVEFVNLTF